MRYLRFLAVIMVMLMIADPPQIGAQHVIATPSNDQDWSPYDMRSTGTVQITGNAPRSGNGSLEFNLSDDNDKAFYQLLFSPISTTSFFGPTFSASFEWMRSSSSTTTDHFAPAFSFFIAYNVSSTMMFAEMKWEHAYNPPGPTPAPEDSWVTSDITDDDFWVWGGGAGNRGPLNTTCGNANVSGSQASWTVVEWLNSGCLQDAVVYGVGTGVGSGWTGLSKMYVDNLCFKGDAGVESCTNWELDREPSSTVPEPATMTLLATGLAGIAAKSIRRRKKPLAT